MNIRLDEVFKQINMMTEKDVSDTSTTQEIYTTLQALSQELKTINLNSERKIAEIEEMAEIQEESADDLVYLMNKTAELKALLEVNQKMLDLSVNKPVIETWFERQ